MRRRRTGRGGGRCNTKKRLQSAGLNSNAESEVKVFCYSKHLLIGCFGFAVHRISFAKAQLEFRHDLCRIYARFDGQGDLEAEQV